jgi:transposase
MVKKFKNREINIDITETEINRRMDQIEAANIDEELRSFLLDALYALVRLDEIVGMKETTLARLRKIFNKKQERQDKEENLQDEKPKKGKNQGKNGKDDYPGANNEWHGHESLKVGERCPDCGKGNLCNYAPGIYIRVTGSPILEATIHETEKFRCSGCQKIFEAKSEVKNQEKYDEKAKAIIALLKYRASFPFYRLEKIQKHFYIPMPTSTQWDLVHELAKFLRPIWSSMVEVVCSWNKFYIDDTTGKVLTLLKENKSGNPERRGIYTTGVMAENGTYLAYLYLTGRKHAGENISKILGKRNSPYPPIVMSDAMGNNNVKNTEVIKTLCLVHGRRQFIDLENQFKMEVDKILKLIGEVYKVENEAIQLGLNASARLQLHREKSNPIMDDLKKYIEYLESEKMVEPNSGLGNALNYIRKHWHGLTQFLRIEGAPIDNNLLEESLRVPVLNRKNWLFYKTLEGAMVGDTILSLIKTCEANGKNPFEYLVWVQKNKHEIDKNPKDFLPWCFLGEKV